MLHTIFLIIYSIGCFFSTALCHIGYFGFLSISGLQFYNDVKFRSSFKQFFKSNKIWIPATFIVIIAFCGIFYSKAPVNVKWSIFFKYIRFLSIFLLIPSFIHNQFLARKFIHYFCLATFAYCLWYPFVGVKKIHLVNSIHSSVFITCCLAFFINLYLFQKSSKKVINWLQISFFLYYLFLINTEKTGPFAFIVIAPIIFIISLKKAISFKMLSYLTITVFAIILLALCKSSILMQRCGTNIKKVKTELIPYCIEINSINNFASVSYRKQMINDGFKLIKERPIYGYGTGSFGYELQQHKMMYLGHDFSDLNINKRIVRVAHPHNEWLLWLIQWGSLGFIAGLLWFGWILIYLIKNRKIDFVLIMHGTYLNLLFIMAACCEALFFTTIPQSFYLMALCACIGSIERKKFKYKHIHS